MSGPEYLATEQGRHAAFSLIPTAARRTPSASGGRAQLRNAPSETHGRISAPWQTGPKSVSPARNAQSAAGPARPAR